ncbi:MAG: hypothetical protein R3C53_15990 [Pirellulaceae bacterium]
MFSRRKIIATTACMLLLSVASVSHAQQRVKLEANLSGNTLASGKAKFESRGNRQKFSVEIEDAAANTRYRVDVRNSAGLVFRAVMRTNALGGFDLNRDTLLGQSVPSISAGDRVIVFDLAARRVLLQGTF